MTASALAKKQALLSMPETMSDADGNKCTGRDMNLLSWDRSTTRQMTRPPDLATQNPGAIHGIRPSTLAKTCLSNNSLRIKSASVCQCLGVLLTVNTLYGSAFSINCIFMYSPFIGWCGSMSRITSLNFSHIFSFIDFKRKLFLVSIFIGCRLNLAIGNLWDTTPSSLRS